MSTLTETIEAGGAQPPATIKVWDPFVRIFHWSLVALFVTAYAIADDLEQVHLAAGYAIAGLLALRIIWGFAGPRHAQFGSFVRSPRVVLAYLRDAARFRAPRYLGHNPAGGAMILALIAMLAATAITGHMMMTDAFWGAKWVEDVHETLAHLTVGLIVLHVLGVVVTSFENRENLVKAMITGRKEP